MPDPVAPVARARRQHRLEGQRETAWISSHCHSLRVAATLGRLRLVRARKAVDLEAAVRLLYEHDWPRRIADPGGPLEVLVDLRAQTVITRKKAEGIGHPVGGARRREG